MSYFPFMMDIQNKDCLVVGGGKIAHRKVLDLLSFGAKVTVISQKVCKEIQDITNVTIIEKEYEASDIQHRFLVIAATNQEDVNRKIAGDCDAQQILVNAVDIKDACSFIFPAIIKKDELVVSISTGGNSPAGAAYLKEKIEKSIPAYYERNMEMLGSVRGLVMEKITSISDRKRLYYELLELADEEGRVLSEEDVLAFIEQFR